MTVVVYQKGKVTVQVVFGSLLRFMKDKGQFCYESSTTRFGIWDKSVIVSSYYGECGTTQQ